MKHQIGDCFISNMNERIMITGYNNNSSNQIAQNRYYFALVYYKRETPKILQYMTDEFIDQSCVKMSFKEKEIFMRSHYHDRGAVDLMAQRNKEVRYKIWYIDKGQKLNGRWKADNSELLLGSIKSLAKRLNRLVKANPQYKVVAVSVVDEKGIVKKNVKFLPKEINEQRFITGYKQRLLAHAKYELGYDISVK